MWREREKENRNFGRKVVRRGPRVLINVPNQLKIVVDPVSIDSLVSSHFLMVRSVSSVLSLL